MSDCNVLEIARRLYPYAYSVVSSENDRAVEAYRRELDFDVLEVPSGAEHNGWRVPNDWKVVRADIHKDGTKIWDGLRSPLGIGVLSPSYSGSIRLEELRKHLYFSEACPNAIPYHWTNLYRLDQKEWAFSVTKAFYDGLLEGEYLVQLETVERPSTMKVLDFKLAGASEATLLLNAHNCHPWQANDDISGCAVGIAVMKALQSRPARRFTYRLVIAPELIGTVHWLYQLNPVREHFAGAIMLKSVGSDGPLKLQHSFSSTSQLDRAAFNVLNRRVEGLVSGPFRTIYGNDETVFDSPGYEIPSISLTRFPFPQYHTDADTPERLSAAKLEETRDVVLEMIDALEASERLAFAARGLVSLSHPRYRLYRPAPAPGIDREEYLDVSRRWNLLMNCLPRELNGTNSGIDLACKYDLPVGEVCDYLRKWKEKGLAISAV